MFGEHNSTSEKVGYRLGFLFSYFIFTTALYLILLVTGRHSLQYVYVMMITLAISIIGFLVRRLIR